MPSEDGSWTFLRYHHPLQPSTPPLAGTLRSPTATQFSQQHAHSKIYDTSNCSSSWAPRTPQVIPSFSLPPGFLPIVGIWYNIPSTLYLAHVNSWRYLYSFISTSFATIDELPFPSKELISNCTSYLSYKIEKTPRFKSCTHSLTPSSLDASKISNCIFLKGSSDSHRISITKCVYGFRVWKSETPQRQIGR